MNVALVCVISFLCIYAGALAGMFLARRLPDHHLDSDSIDTYKAVRSVVAGLTALTVGLLVASAKNSFDVKSNDIRASAAKVVALDRTLAKYGPRAADIRKDLRAAVVYAIQRARTVHEQGADADKVAMGVGIDQIQGKILTLRPENDDQTWLKTTALTLISEIAGLRLDVYESLSTSLQWPLLAVLLFWLSGIFFSFGLTAPMHATVLVSLLVAAASVTAAIYLILELDMPFRGLIQLSTEPLELALAQLKR